MLPVVPGQIMDYGYSDQIVLPFPVTLPEQIEGPVVFEGVADYLICEDVCIPESVDLRLMLSIGAQQLPDERGANLIQAALMNVPPMHAGESSISATGDTWVLSLSGGDLASLRGDARFFPYGHEITHAADQIVSFGEDGLQIELTPSNASTPLPETLAGIVTVGDTTVEIAAAQGAVLAGTSGAAGAGFGSANGANLPLLMGFALIGGLILNLMPCVLPVLSIKAMGLVSATANGETREARAHGLWVCRRRPCQLWCAGGRHFKRPRGHGNRDLGLLAAEPDPGHSLDPDHFHDRLMALRFV